MEQLKNKKNIINIAILIAVALGSFYCGTLYTAKNKSFPRGGFQMMDGRGVPGEAGTYRDGVSRSGARGMMGGVVAGEVISKDATSITVKMQDGSTKIVLVSGSTQVSKSAAGAMEDLTQGVSVVVIGSANTDGSVTAQSVQIRPQGAGLPVKQI
ncbi:MAG: hypothetical protein M0P64_02065 [Candidatus Pacebacteria bacterium]|jgi:hypothetical protein|nr:hypothetical protein [Candidatus Paceibacterota bacterium]